MEFYRYVLYGTENLTFSIKFLGCTMQLSTDFLLVDRRFAFDPHGKDFYADSDEKMAGVRRVIPRNNTSLVDQ